MENQDIAMIISDHDGYFQFAMICNSRMIPNAAMKAEICARLKEQFVSVDDLARLADDELKELFPKLGLRLAVRKWRQDFLTNLPKRLLKAAKIGDLDLVQDILKKHPNLIETVDDEGRTPLLVSSAFGRLPVVYWLVSNGANLEARSNKATFESTALHLAAGAGHKLTVEFLLGRKATFLEAKNNVNETPLNRAVLCGHLEVVEFLVKAKKADIENPGRYGRTPLLQAVAQGHLQVVEWLLDHGANIETRSNLKDHKSMPIHLAAFYGHASIVKTLLARKATLLETKDASNDTALNIAAARGHLGIVQYLVKEGKAAVESRGFHGRTPLLGAAGNGHLVVVEWLLENCANIKAKDWGHARAIHLAAYFGHARIVDCLLKRKTFLMKVRNFAGHTPLFLAKQQNKKDVVVLLQSKGAKK